MLFLVTALLRGFKPWSRFQFMEITGGGVNRKAIFISSMIRVVTFVTLENIENGGFQQPLI